MGAPVEQYTTMIAMSSTQDAKTKPSPVKQMAYGSAESVRKQNTQTLASGQLFRLERGWPYQRAGKTVYATPQFKSLTIYSPTTKTAQLPTTSQTASAITYPIKNR